MNDFKLGMTMAKISMSLSDTEFRRVKPYLDELQDEILELLHGNWNTEELPEKEGGYLVLWKTDLMKRVAYEIQDFIDGKWELDIPQAQGREIEVLAWTELPSIPEEVS